MFDNVVNNVISYTYEGVKMEEKTPPRRPIPPRPNIQGKSEQNIKNNIPPRPIPPRPPQRPNIQQQQPSDQDIGEKTEEKQVEKVVVPKPVKEKKPLSDKSKMILKLSLAVLSLLGAVACFVLLFI